ncbi:carboxymuconolactone decarboxylase family protein [Rhodobacterales bacterium HKCCE2091]|nr:carboxymuconolactone decarboxylase family protein [Rhodobacterales bacterium HKCCE2091]
MPEDKHPLDLVPDLKALNTEVLFGQVWADDRLSKRDRSIATVAMLAAMYRTKELEFHLGFAQDNGLSRDELLALITHVAFYAGWPSAVNATRVAEEVFD